MEDVTIERSRARGRGADPDRAEPRWTLAVCAIFKNEAPYLAEWIQFHRIVGAEHFYLYNNFSEDGFEEVLAPFIERGWVTLREWPVRAGQVPAYEDCLQRDGSACRWIAFIDVDEFLFSPGEVSLHPKLAQFEDCAGLAVNWMLFGSGRHDRQPAGLVMENYLLRACVDAVVPLSHLQYDGPPEARRYRPMNGHYKTIAQPARTAHCLTCHSFSYRDGGEAVDELRRPVLEYFTQSVSVEQFRLNHYWSKSREECLRKISRGRADITGKRIAWELDFRERYLNSEWDTAILPLARLVREAMAAEAARDVSAARAGALGGAAT